MTLLCDKSFKMSCHVAQILIKDYLLRYKNSNTYDPRFAYL